MKCGMWVIRCQFCYEVTFGIICPVVLLSLNQKLTGDYIFNHFFIVASTFIPLPRPAFFYVAVGLEILTLTIWLFGRRYLKQGSSFISGILIFGSLLALGLAISTIIRLSIFFIIWIPLVLIAFVFLNQGVKAFREAQEKMSWQWLNISMMMGMLLVISISLTAVQQPWKLIKCMPDCQKADLANLDLSQIFLDGCSTKVNLSEADLHGANLSNSSLVHCNLALHGANLRGANLREAKLQVVDLREADLGEANLNGARLYQVDLDGADFRAAHLGFKALGRVSMKGADLRDADLRDSDLKGVYFLTGAVYNNATRWPQDFNPIKSGAINH